MKTIITYASATVRWIRSLVHPTCSVGYDMVCQPHCRFRIWSLEFLYPRRVRSGKSSCHRIIFIWSIRNAGQCYSISPCEGPNMNWVIRIRPYPVDRRNTHQGDSFCTSVFVYLNTYSRHWRTRYRSGVATFLWTRPQWWCTSGARWFPFWDSRTGRRKGHG